MFDKINIILVTFMCYHYLKTIKWISLKILRRMYFFLTLQVGIIILEKHQR